MKKIEIYDPAMCCSTGVCGTDVDPKLAQFASDVEWLKAQGVTVERFNLSQQPAAFVSNKTVCTIMATEGTEFLPVTLADGVVMMKAGYPNRLQLADWAGVQSNVAVTETGSSCCSGKSSSGCC